MDPFGIIAILAGAGWIIGKLNEDKKPPPPPNKPATWQRHSPAVGPVPEYRPSPDRVHVPVKVTKSNAADEAIEVGAAMGGRPLHQLEPVWMEDADQGPLARGVQLAAVDPVAF